MKPKRLSEVVIRTVQLEKMISFYLDVIGLETYKKMSSAHFLKVSDDLEGHPQVIAIFDQKIPSNGVDEPSFAGIDVRQSSLHHFAFALEKPDFYAEQARLEKSNHEFRTTTYPDLLWRSLYLYDPDGNVVELVCYDETLKSASRP